MDGLRHKLEHHGLRGVNYMVINHQGEQAQRLHALLAEKLSENITLYKQEEQQPDVWRTLNGQKDDFLIYDRSVMCSKRFYSHFEGEDQEHHYCCHPYSYSHCLSVPLQSGVVVSLTTFHSHTPSLDRATLSVQSEIPTANAYVESAHMRYRLCGQII